MAKTKQSIEEFLKNAQERNLKVRGNADELWFAVDGIKLHSRIGIPVPIEPKGMAEAPAPKDGVVVEVGGDTVWIHISCRRGDPGNQQY